MVKNVILGFILLSFLLTLTYSSYIPLNVRSGFTWHSQACQTLGGEIVADDDLIKADVKRIAMHLDVCMGNNIAAFWTAKKKQKNTIIDPKTGKPLQLRIPRFGRKPKVCPSLLNNNTVLKDCNLRGACSICKIQEPQIYRLKGIAKDSRYDTSYSVDFEKDSNMIMFLGTKNKSILIPRNESHWVLESKDHGELLTLSDKGNFLPTGRKVWTDSFGKDTVIAFSSCILGSQFTCNDGSCIPLDYKYDMFPDCKQEEDEEACDTLEVPANYQKQVAPTEGSRGIPWPVFVSFEIRAFTEIASIDLRLSVDFFIRLRWKDPRISFKDLRNGTALNPLSDDEILSLWTPTLGLTNGLSEFDSKVSEDSVSTFLSNVRKRGKASRARLEDSTEISRYPGKWNDIIVEREYFHDFKCNFDLSNYPFDQQKCFMNFTLRGTTERQVILRKDSTRNITYHGEKRLVEYEIEEITLDVQAQTGSGFSSATVVVVFKRLRIYYYLNVFAQFILLMGVGFMSLIFPVNNFSDRVMTALTVMLVMTCNQQVVNDSLPKTSYFKIIDYYLLISLNSQIFVMVFHTYIYWLCVAEYSQHKQLQNKVHDELESAEEFSYPLANKRNKICGIVSSIFMIVYILLLAVVSQKF